LSVGGVTGVTVTLTAGERRDPLILAAQRMLHTAADRPGRGPRPCPRLRVRKR
jgi:hypothetical protein